MTNSQKAHAELPEGTQHDWQIVAELEPKGYAELRPHDNSAVFHGPVEKVVVNNEDVVEITLKWRAVMALDNGTPKGDWVAADNSMPFTFPNFMAPFEIEDTPQKGKRIRFGFNIVYLDEVKGIDPSKVEGLNIQD